MMTKTKKAIIFSLFAVITGFLLILVLNQFINADRPTPFDKNHDNALDYAEFKSAMSLLFKTLDMDDDGAVTFDEINTARDKSKMPLPKSIAMAIRLNELDSDNDKRITREEFLSDKQLRQLFNRFDVNNDGLIRKGESDAALMIYLFP